MGHDMFLKTRTTLSTVVGSSVNWDDKAEPRGGVMGGGNGEGDKGMK